MKRFEFSEGTSNKFWQFAIKGSVLTAQWGRIGATGTNSKDTTFGSPADAQKAADKMVREKTGKGYVEVGAKAAKNGAAKSTNGVAAKPAKASNVDPKSLELKQLDAPSFSIYELEVVDRVAVALGEGFIISSDGKKFHRRMNPGTTYGFAIIDGVYYACGTNYSISRDQGATWNTVKLPVDVYYFCIFRDSQGTWWMGGDDGTVLTSKNPAKGWKKAPFQAKGKVLEILESNGKLFLFGLTSGTYDGKKYRGIGDLKKATITSVATSPERTMIAFGDAGLAFRSADGGASWKKVRTGVKDDLECCAWVAGGLFACGDNATLLRSLDDGKTLTKIPIEGYKLWAIASWGDGALIGGESGRLFRLAAPNDPYWRGAKDEFIPPPPVADMTFQPHEASAAKDREKRYEKLFAEAVSAHDRLSSKLRAAFEKIGRTKLAQQIDDQTTDDDAAQVYADWLQDQGDPRGELAQIQLRLAKDPKNKELKKTEKALLKKHADVFLGKLASFSSLVKLEWRAGFIHAARIAGTYDDYGGDDDDGDSEEGAESKKRITVEKALEALLAEPSARFLRELTIGIVTLDGENSYNNVAKIIGKHYLPSLRSLFLGDFTSDETEMSWSSLGNLEPIYPAVPNLTSLKLHSGSMKLGTIVLPRLESFEVITGGLDAKAVAAISTARWPGLRKLSMHLGTDEYGGITKVKLLDPILESPDLPRLTHLGIKNTELSNQVIEPLASSKLLPQIEELDLGMGTLGDEGIATMFRLQRAFGHVKLDLDDNFLTKDSKKLLATAKIAFEFGHQRGDGGDPQDRYVSAGE